MEIWSLEAKFQVDFSLGVEKFSGNLANWGKKLQELDQKTRNLVEDSPFDLRAG